MRLQLVTVTLDQANAFVGKHHRHHEPVVGHKFSVGAWSGNPGELCGVAIVGRPLARKLDHRRVCEVLRCCTDGTRNACSILYGACARAAAALGFESIITYTLKTEQGASLRASGWACEADTPGRSWNTPSRPREGEGLGPKWRWRKTLKAAGPVVEDAEGPNATLELFGGAA